MSNNILEELYRVAESRKKEPQEGSYTCYLFEKGIDKILKKIGEEAAETIIAAKGGDNELLCSEICDLIYHVIVMMVERGLPLDAVMGELAERSLKIANLKSIKTTDINT